MNTNKNETLQRNIFSCTHTLVNTERTNNTFCRLQYMAIIGFTEHKSIYYELSNKILLTRIYSLVT